MDGVNEHEFRFLTRPRDPFDGWVGNQTIGSDSSPTALDK
jgi:hypothetical protein